MYPLPNTIKLINYNLYGRCLKKNYEEPLCKYNIFSLDGILEQDMVCNINVGSKLNAAGQQRNRR